MGGFAGAAIAHAGWDVVNFPVMRKVFLFIFLAPIIGLILSYIISVIMLWTCRAGHPAKLEKWFKRLQLVSCALFSIGHGGNDAQKVMGIISAALLVYTAQAFNAGDTIPHWMFIDERIDPITGKHAIAHIPDWVVIGCYTAIALGTLSGGWRIVKTMGTKITKMTPFEGVAAETAGAITLFATQKFGIPVSTTHTITGSIIGVGITKRVSAVKWGVTGRLLIAWLITMPISAAIGMVALWLLKGMGIG